MLYEININSTKKIGHTNGKLTVVSETKKTYNISASENGPALNIYTQFVNKQNKGYVYFLILYRNIT